MNTMSPKQAQAEWLASLIWLTEWAKLRTESAKK